MKTELATGWVDDDLLNTQKKASRDPRIRFLKPSEIRAFKPDERAVLVGDCQIMRGEVCVIGGEPGVGKSTATTELAICGATGVDWLGLPVRTRFKSMIIQNENGRYRLQQEYAARELREQIDDHILVSEPPPFGMTLTNPEFLDDVGTAIETFKPDIVMFDPWNAAAKDDKAADYSSAFEALRGMLPRGENRPALVIVAHTRKPQPNEKRTGGSALMHLLAGSYVLTSVPRSIFIMVRGTAEETDNSVVWFNPKNSNGPCASRSAWERSPAGFIHLPDFDWKDFDDGKGGRAVMQVDHLREALGKDKWARSEAVKRLEKASGLGEKACQNALKQNGKFSAHLIFEDQWVGFRE
jgi:KaiC/GvpD/RAD55 family RecA-like ATPase